MCTLRTPSNPSAGSARSTAWPCGSRIPAFGRMRTRALTPAAPRPAPATRGTARRRAARRPGRSVLGDRAVDGERRVAHALGEHAVAQELDGALEVDRLVVPLRGLRRRSVDG